MKNVGIITWIFIAIILGIVLVYAAGFKVDVGAASNATNSGIKALFGPGKYASNKP